ncbi:hypothetical protein [Chryseobacterium cheonjiense]|uniref:Uncharacterized protein n=1 Tax=Chryseobacterium cheonjiense TaxID=2728845 RepID=A0A7Y0A3A2_9FLAO|nr:hypothetical protein [Chryseobacterium cheonjiense]NML55846.1 hypothetical protein [Chryseobacterium cheonjiense]
MARNNNNRLRINWLPFFQWINSSTAKVTLITTLIGAGYTAGYFSCQFIKDRELLQKEKEYNDLHSQQNIIKNEFDRERSDNHLENNQLKMQLYNLRDSIRKNGKK